MLRLPLAEARCVAPASLTPIPSFVSVLLPPPHLPHQSRIPPVTSNFASWLSVLCFLLPSSFPPSTSSRTGRNLPLVSPSTHPPGAQVGCSYLPVDSHHEPNPPKGARRQLLVSSSFSNPLTFPHHHLFRRFQFWTVVIDLEAFTTRTNTIHRLHPPHRILLPSRPQFSQEVNADHSPSRP